MPKPPVPPPGEPNALRESRADARAKIRSRIEKGEALRALPVNSPELAAQFERDYLKWNDYNEELLRSLFTTNTPRLNYRWAVGGGIRVGGESDSQRYGRRTKEITQRCAALESLAERLEVIALAPGVAGSAPATPEELVEIWSLLHQRVRAAAQERFRDGHYADAVEAALKALNVEVKTIAQARGAEEMDGATLMHTVFSPKKPIIVLADLGTQTGRDMQQGYMELFAGAMSAIRNPKAHDNVSITRERAIHLLFLASTLWQTLDDRS